MMRSNYIVIGKLLFLFNKFIKEERKWVMEPTIEKVKVKLWGEDGNAYAIMGRCHKAWRRAGRSEDEWNDIYKEMTSGNYDNLLQVTMKYFDDEVEEEEQEDEWEPEEGNEEAEINRTT